MWGHFESVVWSGTRFVAVGGTGTLTSSDDGISWSERDTSQGVFGTFYSVAWTGAQFVAVGTLGIWTSPDGTAWTRTTPNPNPLNLAEILWAGDRFVAMASTSSGTGRYYLMTSQNGTNWMPLATLPDSARVEMIWANGKLVIVGAGGIILTSTDVVGLEASGARKHRLSMRLTATHLFLEVPASLRGSQTRMTIHDMGGKKYRDVPVAGRRASVAIGDLPRGIYVLEIRNGAQPTAQRFTLSR
jgi:photosystem II stability/assembly factor-like uncharacterized protein